MSYVGIKIDVILSAIFNVIQKWIPYICCRNIIWLSKCII